MSQKPKIRPILTKIQLLDLYINQQMSVNSIQHKSKELFGEYCGSQYIVSALKRHNITIRSQGESISVATSTLDKNISFHNEEMTEWVDGFLLGDGGIKFEKRIVLQNHKFSNGRYYMASKEKQWTGYGMSKFKVYGAKDSEKHEYPQEDIKHPNPIYSSRTFMHPDILNQAIRWYPLPECAKKIPSDVRITPTSVMLWYLGDGSLTGNKCIKLATGSFSPQDIKNILIKKIEEHGIHCHLIWNPSNGKSYPYIRIRRNSVGKFFDFIGHKSPISCYDHKFEFDSWSVFPVLPG